MHSAEQAQIILCIHTDNCTNMEARPGDFWPYLVSILMLMKACVTDFTAGLMFCISLLVVMPFHLKYHSDKRVVIVECIDTALTWVFFVDTFSPVCWCCS